MYNKKQKNNNNNTNKKQYNITQSRANSMGRVNAVKELGVNAIYTDTVDLQNKAAYAQVMGKLQFKAADPGKMVGIKPQLNDYNPALFDEGLDSKLVPTYENYGTGMLAPTANVGAMIIPTCLQLLPEFFGYTAEEDHFAIPVCEQFIEAETRSSTDDAWVSASPTTVLNNAITNEVQQLTNLPTRVFARYITDTHSWSMYGDSSTVLDDKFSKFSKNGFIDNSGIIEMPYDEATSLVRYKLKTNALSKYGTLTWSSSYNPKIRVTITSDRNINVELVIKSSEITNFDDCLQLANKYINKLSAYNVQQADNASIAMAKRTVQFKQLAIAANDTINPCYTKSLVDLFNSLYYNMLNAINAMEIIQAIEAMYQLEDYMKLGARDLYTALSNDFYSQMNRDKIQQAVATLRTNLYGTRVIGEIVSDIVEFNKPAVSLATMYNNLKLVLPLPLNNDLVSLFYHSFFNFGVNHNEPVNVDQIARLITDNDNTYDILTEKIYELAATLTSATAHLFNAATAQYSTLDTIQDFSNDATVANTKIMAYINNMQRIRMVGAASGATKFSSSIIMKDCMHRLVIEDEDGIAYYSSPIDAKIRTENHNQLALQFKNKTVVTPDHTNDKLGFAVCTNLDPAEFVIINGDEAKFNLYSVYGSAAIRVVPEYSVFYDQSAMCRFAGNDVVASHFIWINNCHSYYPYAIPTFNNAVFIAMNRVNYNAYFSAICLYQTDTSDMKSYNNKLRWYIRMADQLFSEFGFGKPSIAFTTAITAGDKSISFGDIGFYDLSTYACTPGMHLADVNSNDVISMADSLNNVKYL